MNIIYLVCSIVRTWDVAVGIFDLIEIYKYNNGTNTCREIARVQLYDVHHSRLAVTL